MSRELYLKITLLDDLSLVGDNYKVLAKMMTEEVFLEILSWLKEDKTVDQFSELKFYSKKTNKGLLNE